VADKFKNFLNLESSPHAGGGGALPDPLSWKLARLSDLANGDTDPTANRKLAVANWNERSFRSFLKELPYNNDTSCGQPGGVNRMTLIFNLAQT
jgi:hypothetical protein